MSLKSFLVLTAIRGLCRVDGGKKRPIEPDAIIALPAAIAEGLLHLRAIEETDAEPTVELIFLDDDGAARALAADLRQRDHDTLIAAVAEIGGVLIFPDDRQAEIGAATGVALIAANDRVGLHAALRALDGEAAFPGNAAEKAELAAELARLSAGNVELGAISAEAASAEGADPVGVALSALAARGQEIERLNIALAAASADKEAPAKKAPARPKPAAK